MENHENWFEDVPELAHYVKRPSLLAANGFYWAEAVIFAIMQAGLAPLFWLLSAVFPLNAAGYVSAMQILMYLGAMLLPVLAYLLTRHDTLESFRLNPVSPGRTLASVAAAGSGFLAANCLTLVWMLFLEALGGNPSAASDAFSGNLLLDMLLIAILPGVCEELLFRGLIMGAYERWGTWRAIWISALLFTGLHGTVAGIPAQLMLGLALGYVTASTGSIYAAMMLHTTYNAITLLVGYSALEDAAAAAGTPMLEQVGMMGLAIGIVGAIIFVTLLVFPLKYLDSLRIRADEPFGNDAVIEKKKLDRANIVLLVSAAATIIWFYVQDILNMFA